MAEKSDKSENSDRTGDETPDPRTERTQPDGVAGPPPAGPPPTGPPPGAPYPYHPPPPLDPVARLWPVPPGAAAAPIVIAGAALAGGVAAAVLASERVGVNYLLTGLAVVAGCWPVVRHRLRNRTSLAFGLLALGLITMVALRDAPWIVALSLALAVAVGPYALVGGRGWVELLLGGCSLPLAGLWMLPWAGRGAAQTVRAGRGRSWRMVRAIAIAAGLILVFGALLTSADAAFSKITSGLIPDVSVGSVVLRTFLFAFVAGVTLAAAFLAVAPPRWRRLAPGEGRPARMLEWSVPLGALNVLFLSFVTVQAAVLLTDDKDALLRSTGQTYAEYARQGFFQLLFTTVLVIAVIAVAARKAPRDTARDRTVVKIMLGLLCAFTLLIVMVALRRLGLYEQEFGLTRLRLWVHGFELWLGLVVVLIAAAGLRPGRWLPRVVAATGAAGLIGLGALNPDALIAEHNMERFQRTGKIDTDYLSGLSADAVPALDRLPEPHRTCALRDFRGRLADRDSWYTVNLGRQRARAVLRDRPVGAAQTCPESSRYGD